MAKWTANPQDVDRLSNLRPFDKVKSGSVRLETGDFSHAKVAREIVGELFGPPSSREFSVQYWDGNVEEPVDRASRFTFLIRAPSALRRVFLPPSELSLVEAYLRGDVDIEGDVEAAAKAALASAPRLASPGRLARIVRLALTLPVPTPPASGRFLKLKGRAHSAERDRAAVRHHYDVGNDFYRLWLDQRMVYSCAYFESETDSLDRAQTAKLEYLCRKLRLRPGQRLLDIGCGWGALVMYAAHHYGVQAVGITLSQAQAELARERISTAGLSDRCRVDIIDYRDLSKSAPFDRVVSVGMIEHVGRNQLSNYFGKVAELLAPDGLFVNHGIVVPPVDPWRSWGWLSRVLWRDGQFVRTYVFPDGELVPLAEVIRTAEAAGFETRDVENLRDHYRLTLRWWLKRLEMHRSEAVALVGEETYRVWRLYLAGAANSFACGRSSVAQVVFSNSATTSQTSPLPLTRRDLYQSALLGSDASQRP